MRIDIVIDKRALDGLSKTPEQIRKAAASVLKSESNRLRTVLKSYAQSMVTPVAPLTRALRKGQVGIGPMLARLMAYDVDSANLTAKVGILEGGARPVNRRVAVLARRQAKGYNIRVTRQAQKRLGSKLEGRYKVITQRGQWGRFGGLSSFIPKIGTHKSMARPIVSVVWARERMQVIGNIRRNFAIKVRGGRF